MNRYAVIMAGGSGTRFWPLSRQKHPKQLLKLFSDRTLIEETVERISPIFPAENILVICNAEYSDLIRQALPKLPACNVVAEPAGRNTAPCIALAAEILIRRDPEAIMCVMPADHFIKDNQRFQKLLDASMKAAEKLDTLATIGIIPTMPHTGYGYIHAQEFSATIDDVAVLKAEHFVEKPGKLLAEEYLHEGHYYWNSGIFAWKCSVVLEEISQQLPDVFGPMNAFFQASMDPEKHAVEFERMFCGLPSISIDYGIMEKSRRVVLIRGDFGWNDVGSWDALEDVVPSDAGNVIIGDKAILSENRRCIIYARDTVVACLGLEDVVVVAAGDSVLVAHKSQCQNVKQVVEKLRELNRTDLL